MAKIKPPSTEVQVISASANVRTQEFGPAHQALAAWMHIDISASANVRTERAVQAYNIATLNMTEAGLLLASVRAEVGAEGFAAVLEERGLAKERAYELMRGATLIAYLPPEQREQVMALSKSKVLALAGASAAAVEAALEDEDLDLNLIGVRALRGRIRELEAAGTDLAVQRDTAEADAEGLRKQLKRAPNRDDQVPLVVADMRAEIMALGRKADLTLSDFNGLGVDIVNLMGTEAAHDWADATLRLALSQLLALRMQLDGLVTKYLREVPGGDPTPTTSSYLSQQEVRESALMFSQLAQTHTYEAALREWERERARPRGKGRPKSKPDKPVAPAGAGGAA